MRRMMGPVESVRFSTGPTSTGPGWKGAPGTRLFIGKTKPVYVLGNAWGPVGPVHFNVKRGEKGREDENAAIVPL
jgi:hypothetical protein